MAIGHYCLSCQSAYCNHALQINEHNSRLEHGRLMAGMPLNMMASVVMSEDNTISVAVPTDSKKDKRLLLLRRR